MNNFVKDTLEINEKLNSEIEKVEPTILEAAFLPFYIDPKTMQLNIILVRTIMPGAYTGIGMKMGLTTLKMQLPKDNPLTIEQAYEKLNLPANFQEAIPLGSTMSNPINSSLTTEMVLIQIDPPSLIDEKRGIIYQEKGKYEIGVITFNDILTAIQSNLIQETVTRLMLSELYILILEESKKEQDTNNKNNKNGIIGNGYENYPEAAQKITDDEIEKTTDIPDEIIEQNKQMDYGAIYVQNNKNDSSK